MVTPDSPSAPFEVPEPRETSEVRLPDGGGILLRRHGNPGGPRLVFSHGVGLGTDLYYPLWGRFLMDFDVVVFDLRNHGWNPVGDISTHNVPQFAKDMETVADEIGRGFGRKPAIGIYHSLSSLAVCLSASHGEGYAGLFLLDPPVCQTGKTYVEFDAAAERSARSARRRQARFESLEQYAELLGWFPAFRRALPGVAELAARTTLRPDEEGGGFVLRCPREYEARIMEYITAFAVFVDFGKMRCPVKVLGADPTIPFSYLPSFNLAVMMDCDYDFIPDTTHMLPFERPDVCRERILEFAAECGVVPAAG